MTYVMLHCDDNGREHCDANEMEDCDDKYNGEL